MGISENPFELGVSSKSSVRTSPTRAVYAKPMVSSEKLKLGGLNCHDLADRFCQTGFVDVNVFQGSAFNFDEVPVCGTSAPAAFLTFQVRVFIGGPAGAAMLQQFHEMRFRGNISVRRADSVGDQDRSIKNLSLSSVQSPQR